MTDDASLIHIEAGHCERPFATVVEELVYPAVQAYFGVLLARRQEQVAEQALTTAQAIEASSRARVESGMVVDSDLLSAQVVTSRRKQELIQIQDALALARAQLALALGMPSDTLPGPGNFSPRRRGGFDAIVSHGRAGSLLHGGEAQATGVRLQLGSGAD